MVLGGLTAVALTLLIVLTAVELGSQVGDIRGGGKGATPASKDDLAELAARIISPPYPMPGGSSQTATLHPGALPPNAGFDLRIPQGARLFGSVRRQRTNANPSFDTVLDVQGSADDVTSFYERELGKKGLTTPPAPQQMQPGGFQGTASPAKGSMFCKGDGRPYVSVSVFTRTSSWARRARRRAVPRRACPRSVSPRSARRTVCCCRHRGRAWVARVNNPTPSRPRPRPRLSSSRSSHSSSPQRDGHALPAGGKPSPR